MTFSKLSKELGQLVGYSAGLMIKRFQVRIQAVAAREFSSPESTLCADLFSFRSTPVLPQWHLKDLGHSAKSAGGRLHLNTYTPLTHRSRSGLTMLLSRQCGNLSGNELTRNLSGNTQLQSSQLVQLLGTDRGLKSGISLHKLISTLTKAQAGNELSNILPKFSHERKKPPPLPPTTKLSRTYSFPFLFFLFLTSIHVKLYSETPVDKLL